MKIDRKVTKSSPLTLPTARKRLYFSDFKELLVHFNGTAMYQGYDLNPIWQDIQRLSQSKLSKTEHKIEFFTTNLFVDCHDNGMKIDLLIFNYLLSDAVKFMTFTQRIKFLEEIKTFVIDKRIKVLIFNDINYYGNCQKLDSGIQMFKELFSLIKVNNKVKKCNCSYFCFPEDPYRGSEKWEYHKSNHLIFSISDFNSVVSCNSKCRSKQALIKIEYK